MKPEQITAWALDEASAEELHQLEAALLENPQDKQKAEETKTFCDFLLSELRDDSLALTETQRDKLKAQPVVPVSRVPAVSRMPASQTKWRIGIIVRLAVAACAVLGGFWTWQSYSLKHNTPHVSVADKPGIKVNLPLAIDSKKKTAQPKEKPKRTPMTIAMEPPVGKPLSPAPMPSPVAASTALALNKDQRVMTPGDVESLKRIQDQNAYALNLGNKKADEMARVSDIPVADMRLAPQVTEFDGFINLASLVTSSPAAAGQGGVTLGGTVSGPGGIMKVGTGQGTLNGANAYAGTIQPNTGVPVLNSTGTSALGSHAAPASAIALGTNSVSVRQVVAGTPMTKAATGTVVLGAATNVYTGDNTFTGGVTIYGGTTYGGTLSPAPVASASTAAVTFGTTTASTPGNISGTGSLTKLGTGALTLSGATTYTGTTTIYGGTLALASAPAAASTTLATVGATNVTSAGTTLDLSGAALPASATSQQSPGPHWSEQQAQPVTVTSNSSTATPATPTVVLAAGAIIATATPVPSPFALNSTAQPDARYFSGDTMSPGFATKDIEHKQEVTASRRSDPSGESYTRIIENEMKDVQREPLSTLSIDVDTASYANVRRFLSQNMTPPPDAVRIEELVNYFPTAEEGPAHEAKEPFAVRVELAPCPWQPVHRLARIAIKGREMDKDRKASNLVFLVDVSGSMNESTKLPLVQQSLRMLTEQMGEGDRVTMVVYAGSSGVVLPPTNGEKKAEILAAIDRLSAGGSTHGSAGIKLAYEQAVAGFIKGGVNRVILCTDGDFNVGVSSPEELEKLIKHKAKTGVFLSVLGFGSGNLQDRTMETLADKGNGNYAYIDSLSEARKVLVEQMSGTLDTIAKDVKIQVEFNPAAVRSYRLIGYENRLLAKEDFNDDTKDAGEIGAGHSVVALYEIVPANLPPGAEPRPAVDNLKYQAPAISHAQLAEAAKSGETMTVKLRYKAPDSDLSKLIEVPYKDEGKTLTASSEEFKFSAAVAGFGLLLRDSDYKGTLSWETVRRLALDGKGSDKLGYRGEFLQLIDKARSLKETRP